MERGSPPPWPTGRSPSSPPPASICTRCPATRWARRRSTGTRTGGCWPRPGRTATCACGMPPPAPRCRRCATRRSWVERLAYHPAGQLPRRAPPAKSCGSGTGWAPWSARTPTTPAPSPISPGSPARPRSPPWPTAARPSGRSTRPEPLRRYVWKGSSLVLAWSPDATMFATGDQDQTVHFWYADSGKDLPDVGLRDQDARAGLGPLQPLPGQRRRPRPGGLGHPREQEGAGGQYAGDARACTRPT